MSDPRRPLDEGQRRHAESLIERAKTFVAGYLVELSPATAQLWVDARAQAFNNGETLRMGVGSHELVARAPGYAELRRHINVKGGEELTLQLELTPTQAPLAAPAPVAPVSPASATTADVHTEPPVMAEGRQKQGRFWTWVVAGGAVALGGVSTGLWLQSKSDADTIRGECEDRVGTPTQCRSADYDDEGVKDLETAHQITLGLAIAAGVGAVVLYAVEGDTPAEQTALSLGPASVSLSGRF